MRLYSEIDVAAHNRSEDCWIIVENRVFDVTDFLSKHPGGAKFILRFAGKDATKPFQAMFHGGMAREELEKRYVGSLAREHALPITKDLHNYTEFDQAAARNECLWHLPSSVQNIARRYINDSRDLIMVSLLANLFMFFVPAIACLLLAPYAWLTHLVGITMLATMYSQFAGRFILMMHYSSHSPLFKESASFLNHLSPYLFAPLFGISPGVYKLHHVIMHHLENNQAGKDLSSTSRYQRDNFLHFLHYWLNFAATTFFKLPAYAIRAGHYRQFANSAISLCAYFATIYVLWEVNSIATFWMLVFPYCMTSFLLMFGNWSQHIFVNPTLADSSYGFAFEAINGSNNQMSFNDGYHVVHHNYPSLHWTELPKKFNECVDQYINHDVFVFEGISNMEISYLVFTKQIEKLVPYFKQLGKTKLSHDEVVEKITRRLAPCQEPRALPAEQPQTLPDKRSPPPR